MPEGDWTPGEQQSDHAKTMVVSGCNHAAVADHLQGRFHKAGMNHGKPVYNKEEVPSGSEVHAYFWDGRDGPDLCGWWFRAKVGGDTVWAYNANKASESPPWWGWQVPHHGPVDPSIVIEFGEDKRTQQEWAQQQQMPQTPKSLDQHWEVSSRKWSRNGQVTTRARSLSNGASPCHGMRSRDGQQIAPPS